MQFDREMIDKITNVAKKYAPEIITGAGIVSFMRFNAMTTERKLQLMKTCYGEASTQYQTYKRKVERKSHSNNWLKMHGQPLRRGKENERVF